ncbi:unnamed protein product [Miscanthus lutarioriparius]|uniref:Uncharacterized protein n=1 Tax=Miscanthus lutarioriparius TaxID=422564 RepID=A0A811SPQ9_9POAL|nr:unnamed protein product [Miscanthus lutarioriparius]
MGIFVLLFKWRISAALAMISSTGTGDKSTVLGMWMVSIAGELWFALMSVLDQLPKMQPVRRTVYVRALDESMMVALRLLCATAPDAFRGTAPINLTDRLYQVLRWAVVSHEILFSRNNALLAGGWLHPLQGLAYLNTTVYPFTSMFLIAYCGLFPAIQLVTGNGATTGGAFFSIIIRPPSATYITFVAALMLTLVVVAVLEARWSGIALVDWWRNQQFCMVSATSAYLAAAVQVALKVAAGKEILFKLTSKQRATSTIASVKDRFAELALRREVDGADGPDGSGASGEPDVHGCSDGRGVVEGQPNGGVRFGVQRVRGGASLPLRPGAHGSLEQHVEPLLLLVAFFTVRLLCFVIYVHIL